MFGKRDVKGDKKDIFIFDGWFDLKRSTEDVMNVGADMVGMVKIILKDSTMIQLRS